MGKLGQRSSILGFSGGRSRYASKDRGGGKLLIPDLALCYTSIARRGQSKLAIRLPEGIEERLNVLAKETGRTKTYYTGGIMGPGMHSKPLSYSFPYISAVNATPLIVQKYRNYIGVHSGCDHSHCAEKLCW